MSLHFKGIFSQYIEFKWPFFAYFQQCKVPFHWLLACIVSGEKSVKSLSFSVYVFIPSPSRIFFLTGFQQFHWNVVWCSFFVFILSYGLLSSWTCGFILLSKFGIYFFIISAFHPERLNCMLNSSMLFDRSLSFS
jgi:hypothetical protein